MSQFLLNVTEKENFSSKRIEIGSYFYCSNNRFVIIWVEINVLSIWWEYFGMGSKEINNIKSGFSISILLHVWRNMWVALVVSVGVLYEKSII